MQGTVNRIPEGKMFGFIKVEGEKNDYFFHKDDFSGHWQDLVHDITHSREKVVVNFTPEKGAKGPRATDVKRLDWPNQG